MVKWSGELLDLKSVYSTVLQDVYTSRLKKAMDRYVQGDSNGKRSGRPRFKSIADYRSFKFPQVKQEWIDAKNAVLYLPFIGGIQIRLHRSLPDGFNLKTIQVIKKADGWHVNLCVEDPTVPEFTPDGVIPTWSNSTGMDAVLHRQFAFRRRATGTQLAHEDDFLALSDGQKLPSLKSFRKSQSELAAVSKRKAARKRGSKTRRKLGFA